MPETVSIVSEKKVTYKTAPKYVSIEAYYKAEEKSLGNWISRSHAGHQSR